MSRDIEFLFEIGALRNLERTWKQFLGTEVASDLEHSFRVAFIALIIARMEGGANEERIIKMALVHDLAESRTSDHTYLHKAYVSADEHRAGYDMFKDTLLENLFSDVLEEYEHRESAESKIVKDADNLDVDVELKELEERGSNLPAKWAEKRRIVRDEKLYTESAKKLWDALQDADAASWHLVFSNK